MIGLKTAAPWRMLLGVALGLAAAAAVLPFCDGTAGGSPEPPDGPLLSECDGAIGALVIHYTSEAADVVLPTYRDLLRQLPTGVTAYVVTPDRAAFAELVDRVGTTACTLVPVAVGHPITAWSRDRWLALGGRAGQATTLLCPRGEDGAAIWPARAGDQQVAADLAAALGPAVRCRYSSLLFDGGDLATDGATAFARPTLALRNVGRTVPTRAALERQLAAAVQRRVLLLDDAPDHHVAMYLAAIGDRTVLVGDPRLADGLLADPAARQTVAAALPGGADFTPATVARLEAVARKCRDAGYRVRRIPLVPGGDGRTYLTYVNAILDQRDGRRIVYMPVYAGCESLNRAAAAVWCDAGYEVRPVACDACIRNFGALHCLVNVLRRN